jgi:myo-inositol-hexaphosphate 3-phosphohydrolase/SAM-dependent methyltransferase
MGSKRTERHRPAGRDARVAWTKSRSRGFKHFKRRFSAGLIRWVLRRAARDGRRPRVLEIGTGHGRLLLDLLAKYRELNLDLHGLNRATWPGFQGRKSIRRSAVESGNFREEEIDALELPRIHFHDASKLRFPDAFFDLVLSQVSFFYIERKDLALSEIWRVLKPGGRALLQLDSARPGLPSELRHETPRFVVRRDGRDVPLGFVFEELRARGFDVEFKRQQTRGAVPRRHFLLTMRKNRDDELPLSDLLEFDAVGTMPLVELAPRYETWRDWFRGIQSAYLARVELHGEAPTDLDEPSDPGAVRGRDEIVPRRRFRVAAAAAAALLVSLVGFAWLARVGSEGPSPLLAIAVESETQAVDSGELVADDPAIWIDPVDPERSLILAAGDGCQLRVYDLAGREIQCVPGRESHSIDLRDGFDVAGTERSLVASVGHERRIVEFHYMDAASRRLSPLGSVEIGVAAAGISLHRDSASDEFSFFVTGNVEANGSEAGIVEQWRLGYDVAQGAIAAQRVRRIDVGGAVESCAVDDELRHLFVAEEKVGIWRYSIGNGSGEDARLLVDGLAPSGRVTGRPEGVALYVPPGKPGYLVVSSHESRDYCLYERLPPHAFVGRFSLVGSGAVDGVSAPDGIEIAAAAIGRRFPAGFMVAKDDADDQGRQNYKLVAFDRLLAGMQ